VRSGAFSRSASVESLDDRGRAGQRAGALVLLDHAVGVVLALGHVRLVERVDAERGAGGRGGDLPAQELGADPVRSGDVDADDGMAGRFDPVGGGGGLFVALFQLQRDENTVVAVRLRIARWLAVDGDDALAALAGALGYQLLSPGAEAFQTGRGEERQLVASRLRQRGQPLAEGGGVRSVDCGRGGQQLLDVDADGGSGHETEEGERGEAPADVRWIDEDGVEPGFARPLVQWRLRIGDGDEVFERARVACGVEGAFGEIALQRRRLDGRARLAGDDEECRRHVDPVFDAHDRQRVGGVQDEQLREAGRGAERALEDLGGERTAAHPEEHGVAEAQFADPVSETAQLVEAGVHRLVKVQPAEALPDLLLDGGIRGPE